MELHPALLLGVTLLPGVLGCFAAWYLRPALIRILTDLCEGEDRADFWTRLSTLGLIAVPTALALMRAEAWHGLTDPAEIIRALLSISLNGVLIVLGLLTVVMWRQIPRRAAPAASKGSEA